MNITEPSAFQRAKSHPLLQSPSVVENIFLHNRQEQKSIIAQLTETRGNRQNPKQYTMLQHATAYHKATITEPNPNKKAFLINNLITRKGPP